MTDVTDYMIVVGGTSNRHVKAIVDHVLQTAKSHAVQVLGTEGRDRSDWVLLDLADVVVHVMRAETRAFYELERLWEALPWNSPQPAPPARTSAIAARSRPHFARLKLRVLAVGKAPRWIDEGFAHYAARLPAENSLELAIVSPAPPADGRARAACGGTPEGNDGGAGSAWQGRIQRGFGGAIGRMAHGWPRCGAVDRRLGRFRRRDAPARSARIVVVDSHLPHQLVRVLLAEQIYRAWAILGGHPYHRAYTTS